MISVVGYENQNNVIYYVVQFENTVLQKRFSQFEELHQSLLPYFPLPNLPPKQYVTVLIGKSIEQLEKRQKALDIYIKELYKNPRIVKSYQFQQFLGLAQTIQMIYEFEGVSQPIKDFTINFDMGLMLVLGSEKKSVPSIFNKVNQNSQALGTLECWLQKEEVFKKEWTHSFIKQTSCFHHLENTVVIGFIDGSLTLFLLNQQNEIASFKEYNQHSSKVLAVHLINGCLCSISESEFKVFSMNKNDFLINQSLRDLNGMLISDEKAYVYDQVGIIYVYDLHNQKMSLLLKFETQLENIKGITKSNNKLYSVNQNGIIQILETDTYTVLQKGKGKVQSKEISNSESRQVIYIGNKDGSVTAHDSSDFSSLFIINAHINSVSKIRNFENENLLITAGEDRYIRAWRLPNILISDGSKQSSLKQQY
ncbi:unnamed protein product [Paramecium pentaurelia]|uniref:PX domain-containing protein n=1 Tax=Paramecium pentaurelia TaxID=43138 RepID=A0A8S1THG8_9CILI|nr:unnamed protein product [Paramecium pentaurelia]